MLRWWRAQLLFLHLTTRSQVLCMSLSGPPVQECELHLGPASDSSEVPDVKKPKIEHPGSSQSDEKNMSWLAGVPCTAFHCSPTSTKTAELASNSVPFSAFRSTHCPTETINLSPKSVSSSASDCTPPTEKATTLNLTPKFDFPSSAVRIAGPSVTCTSTSLSSCTSNEDIKNVQRSDPDASGSPGCPSMEIDLQQEQDTSSQESDLPDTTHTDMTLSSDAIEMEETSDSISEKVVGQAEDMGDVSCDIWKEFPFFALEEVDGGACSSKQVDRTGQDGSENSMVDYRKRRRRSGKKPVKADKEKKPGKRPSPNAFVAVRIPSPDIKAKLEEIQQALIEKDKRLEATLVSPAKNHITLMVMKLDKESPEEIEKAKLALCEAIRRAVTDLDLLNDPLELKFSGLGNFSKSVLFAKVAEGRSRERLIAMAGIVESVFVDKGLASDSDKAFVPHLTIAKMSKVPVRKTKWKMHKKQKKNKSEEEKDIRGIAPSAYAELVDTEFGSQTIKGLELLSMTAPPTEDGYYYCYEKYSFNSCSALMDSSQDESVCESLEC